MDGDKKKNIIPKQQSYLEIYIEENGKMKFTPLTRGSASVVKAFLKKEEDCPSFYCG